MSRYGLPVCSFTIFSELSFDLDFFASSEKWFATLKKVFSREFSYKNTSTLIYFLYKFLNE